MLAAIRGLSRPLGAAALARRPRALATAAKRARPPRMPIKQAPRTTPRAPRAPRAPTQPVSASLRVMQENLEKRMPLLAYVDTDEGKELSTDNLDEMLEIFYRNLAVEGRIEELEEEIEIVNKFLNPNEEKVMDLAIPTPVSTDHVVRKGLIAARKAQLAFSQHFVRRHRELENNTSAYQLILLFMELGDFKSDQRKTFTRDMLFLEDHIEEMTSPQARDLARAEWRAAYRKIALMLTSTQYFYINGLEHSVFLEGSLKRALFPAYHTLLDDENSRLEAIRTNVKFRYDSFARSFWQPVSHSFEDQCVAWVANATLDRTLDLVHLQMGLPEHAFAEKLAMFCANALQDTFWRSSDDRRLIAPQAEPAVEAFVNANIPTQAPSIYARDLTMVPRSLHPGTYTWQPQNSLRGLKSVRIGLILGHIMVRREDGSISNAPYRTRKTDDVEWPDASERDFSERPDFSEVGRARIYGSASDRRFLHCAISVDSEMVVENRTIFGDFLPGVPQTETLFLRGLYTIEMDLPRDVEINPDDADNLDLAAAPFNARVTGIYDVNQYADLRRDSRALLRSSLA